MKKKLIIGIIICTSTFFSACSFPHKNIADEEVAKSAIDTKYEQLESDGLITETDYTDWSNELLASGDPQKAREILIKAHQQYPSVEYVQEISNIEVTTDDYQTITLAIDALTSAKDGYFENSIVTISTEEWNKAYKDSLVGVRRHTSFDAEDGHYDVYSDDYSTDIICRSNDNTYRQLYISSTKSYIFQSSKSDGYFNGGFSLDTYTIDGTADVSFGGTLSNNVCIGEFEIQFNGIAYVADFDENGHTLCSQKDALTKQGQVIYAYDRQGVSFLATPGSKDTFTIDTTYLGIEEE